MPVLMLVKGFDAPVNPGPGRWLAGETVDLVDVGQTLSYREANPPQLNGGFYQVTISDRDKTDPDMLEYMQEYRTNDDPPALLKRRVLQLDETGLDQLVTPASGDLTLNFIQLVLITESAANP